MPGPVATERRPRTRIIKVDARVWDLMMHELQRQLREPAYPHHVKETP